MRLSLLQAGFWVSRVSSTWLQQQRLFQNVLACLMQLCYKMSVLPCHATTSCSCGPGDPQIGSNGCKFYLCSTHSAIMKSKMMCLCCSPAEPFSPTSVFLNSASRVQNAARCNSYTCSCRGIPIIVAMLVAFGTCKYTMFFDQA